MLGECGDNNGGKIGSLLEEFSSSTLKQHLHVLIRDSVNGCVLLDPSHSNGLGKVTNGHTRNVKQTLETTAAFSRAVDP